MYTKTYSVSLRLGMHLNVEYFKSVMLQKISAADSSQMGAKAGRALPGVSVLLLYRQKGQSLAVASS